VKIQYDALEFNNILGVGSGDKGLSGLTDEVTKCELNDQRKIN